MWKDWVAVGVGGMVGSLARYGIVLLFALIGPAWLPLATLAANVLGCFAMGYISQWAYHEGLTHHWWVVGARVGLLGGFTTFSSFGLDVFREWQAGRATYSAGLVLSHCLFGLAAIALGIAAAQRAD